MQYIFEIFMYVFKRKLACICNMNLIAVTHTSNGSVCYSSDLIPEYFIQSGCKLTRPN